MGTVLIILILQKIKLKVESYDLVCRHRSLIGIPSIWYTEPQILNLSTMIKHHHYINT